MKRCIATVLVLLCFMTAVGAEEVSIFREAGVLPVFSQRLQLSTGEPLLLVSDGSDVSLTFDLRGYYSLSFRNAHWDVDVYDALILDLDDPMADSAAQNFTYVGATWYLTGLLPMPIQVFAEGSANPGVMTTEPGESLIDSDDPGVTLSADWCAGVGLGRLVDVTPVADALAMAENLDLDLSREQILEVASIIAKAGEYQYRHRGRFDEAYYGDIAAALGMEDQALAVQRAVRDTWTVSRRSVGWSVRVAPYCQSFSDTELRPPALRLTVDVGIPIGLSMQLSPYLFPVYEYGASDVTLTAGTRFTWDHIRHWSEMLDASVSLYPAPFGGMDVGYALSAGTYIHGWERFSVQIDSWVAGEVGASPELGTALYFWWYLL